MNAENWLSAYAERLGTDPPTPAELGALLALAGEAAHASERLAAPVACWMAAKAGVVPGDALARARQMALADERVEPAADRPASAADRPASATDRPASATDRPASGADRPEPGGDLR